MLWAGDDSEEDRHIPWLQVNHHRAYARLLLSLTTSSSGSAISSPHPLRAFTLKLSFSDVSLEDTSEITEAMISQVWEPLEDALLTFPLLSRVAVLFDGVAELDVDTEWEEEMEVRVRAQCLSRLCQKVILDVKFQQETSLRQYSPWYTEFSSLP